MISKERVKAVFEGVEPDRVPINYAANPGIHERLLKHYGLPSGTLDELLDVLGVDFRKVGAPYVGPRLHEDIPERGVKVNEWGIHRRWVEHETGGYWDYCDFPLRDADEQTVADWPMPSPDDYDYSGVRARCEACRSYAVVAGGAGFGDVINSSGMLRGMEQTLVDLISGEPAGLSLARRRTDIMVETMRRTLEAAGGGVDILWMGEDLGTQIAPMISLDLYRDVIRPFHEQCVSLGKAFDIPVVVHTCGCSSWAYEDFIEMGVSGVDTLQPEAKDMDPASLKERFGGRLVFHGCISTAGPVANGTVQETVADCRQILDIMKPGGGYCFSPTHQLQDNSPTENVVAMYDTAREYGRY